MKHIPLLDMALYWEAWYDWSAYQWHVEVYYITTA